MTIASERDACQIQSDGTGGPSETVRSITHPHGSVRTALSEAIEVTAHDAMWLSDALAPVSRSRHDGSSAVLGLAGACRPTTI